MTDDALRARVALLEDQLATAERERRALTTALRVESGLKTSAKRERDKWHAATTAADGAVALLTQMLRVRTDELDAARTALRALADAVSACHDAAPGEQRGAAWARLLDVAAEARAVVGDEGAAGEGGTQ